ncbi:cob(I)yrinic acid a,c-diamide adenosyltransferase [Chloroflexota bacterium]
MTIQRNGIFIVNTGEGKGKTTAELDLLMRASGQGLRTSMIQFIKAKTGRWVEETNESPP